MVPMVHTVKRYAPYRFVWNSITPPLEKTNLSYIVKKCKAAEVLNCDSHHYIEPSHCLHTTGQNLSDPFQSFYPSFHLHHCLKSQWFSTSRITRFGRDGKKLIPVIRSTSPTVLTKEAGFLPLADLLRQMKPIAFGVPFIQSTTLKKASGTTTRFSPIV